ncbi:MAG: ferritin-like domain-containing protein [Alphaproteobacteria bacterium]|nr:ferritin-like domain-containing protein [Alphaproteobacteria bacterium]
MTHLAAAVVAPSPAAVSSAVLPPFRIGSEEHKRSFCSVLIDLFDPYKPSILAWPKLSPDAERRLTGLPFWDVAVQTEGYASSRMQAMSDTVTDPLIREAIALNAFEEGRHKLVIRNMLRFYSIPIAPEQDYSAPRDAEWKFIRTGYGECFDSFFAFGLFKMAKDSGYFPAELVDVFEPVVQEEARHILFFVNWVAYTSANKTLLPRLWFRARCMAALVLAGLGRLSLAGAADGGKSSDNFVVAGGEALTTGLTPRRLVEIALAEDTRRMERYDPRLLRPQIMPFLGRLALKIL